MPRIHNTMTWPWASCQKFGIHVAPTHRIGAPLRRAAVSANPFPRG